MNVSMWGCVCAVVIGTLAAGGSHAQAHKTAAKPLTAATPAANNAPTAALAEAQRLRKTSGMETAARRVFNQVYFHPAATADQKAQVRQALAELNTATIFSTKVFDGDNLAYACTVRSGDTLSGLARQSGCPVEIIRQINAMKPADVLRAGSTIKLLRGPFHAQVNKSACTLDIFATNPSGERTLLWHARVSVGKNNSTPEGQFRVAGKAEKATWYPPSSMKAAHPAPVKWGEKGYPLGKDGLFMRLSGAERATESIKGIGLHSTDDQAGIGKPRSHGCVRIGDKDVRQVYNLLTDGSDVRIAP